MTTDEKMAGLSWIEGSHLSPVGRAELVLLPRSKAFLWPKEPTSSSPVGARRSLASAVKSIRGSVTGVQKEMCLKSVTSKRLLAQIGSP